MRDDKVSYLQQINEIASKLPLPVLEDINNRIRDWIVSGGNEDDEYIGQQLRFAQNYLNVHGE
ncbi:hypothetical protein P4H56_23880 [Bacillus cereus]|uniref:DUF6877 domain-containing protein n=2 Tax=Bacillus thuringiensis TaxID=1428 RepID=A0A643MZD5_BACTU|nr:MULTISPECIES: DUF6877 family protein [Bacillus cereus group]KAB1358088.1 hypothetical protein FPG90_07755 [Bacillus thuringiensis]KAB1358385.1 hypothetical protein FPG91_08570 [Bacillus thuringiensis]KAB1362025.1 hypothetical protein FPG94_08710 [Bacillus thuringiensis]KAB1368405.1 hypothetical protein FPG89_24485 [Bacillus thuringiensis]KAB1371049.1 hypothetical protein FPG95_07745 [Bacillus thuringiensis]